MSYTPYPTLDVLTTEHFTGEYVEGKAIHRKLVKQSGNLTHSSVNTFAHGITGLTKVVGMYGTINRSSGTTIQLDWHDRTTGTAFHIRTYISGSNIAIELGTGWTGSGNVLSDAWVVIEYLK